MKKKIALVSSFSIAGLLIVGQFTFAEQHDSMMNMMNGNGMSKMMEAMNSPEGQKMMKSCGEIIDSMKDGEEKDTSY